MEEGLVKLFIASAVGALATAIIGGLAKAVTALVRALIRRFWRKDSAAGPPRRRMGALLAIGRGIKVGVTFVPSLIERLPPVMRRTSPWRAAAVGGPLVGFGIGGYFRTGADALVGAVLTIPILIASTATPDTTEQAAAQSSVPAWAYVLSYVSMGLSALYAYFRAVSSNRKLEATFPITSEPRSPAGRRQILEREVALLVAQDWRVESYSDYEAVVERVRRPNQGLNLLLTFHDLLPLGPRVDRADALEPPHPPGRAPARLGRRVGQLARRYAAGADGAIAQPRRARCGVDAGPTGMVGSPITRDPRAGNTTASCSSVPE
jgi:hypothetical protein